MVPLAPPGTITGFSKNCSITAVGVTVSTASTNQVYLTSTGGPFVAADVCTVSFASSTGNYANGDGVKLMSASLFPVTNQITTGTPTITQTAVGCYVPNVPEPTLGATAWLALPNEVCELPVNSAINVFSQLTLTVGAYNNVPRLFCADNGGSRYFRIEADYGGHGAPLCARRGHPWHDIDRLPVSHHGEL